MANSRSGKVMAALLGRTWEEASGDPTPLQMGCSPSAICPLTAGPAQPEQGCGREHCPRPGSWDSALLRVGIALRFWAPSVKSST